MTALLRRERPALLERTYLSARGAMLAGRAVSCNLCGHSFRHYVHGGGSWSPRTRGYCPRCNAKARHRRVWVHIEDSTMMLLEPGPTLLIAPKPCEVGAFRRRGVAPTSIDLVPRAHTTHTGDVTDLPFDDASFRYIVCVHVLEHVEDDHRAMAELSRVLRPDGDLVLSVPSRLDQPTYEDPTIVSPAERQQHFGEADHHRVYGADIVDRLASHGLTCRVFAATDLEAAAVDRFGLTNDEHVFHCRPSQETEGGSP